MFTEISLTCVYDYYSSIKKTQDRLNLRRCKKTGRAAWLTDDLTIYNAIWGLCCQKQVSQSWISNCIPQNTVGCNYISLLEIPASGNKVHMYTCCVRHDLDLIARSMRYLGDTHLNINDSIATTKVDRRSDIYPTKDQHSRLSDHPSLWSSGVDFVVQRSVLLAKISSANIEYIWPGYSITSI